MLRTHTCWELTEKQIDQNVQLSWWVSNRRDHGWIIFIDLRDRYWVTQIVFDPEHEKSSWEVADDVRSEYVIQVEWKIRYRPQGQENPKLTTWKIEVICHDIQVLSKSNTTPFEVSEYSDVTEDVRFKYRYLDLRRKKILNNIEIRDKMNTFTRDWFHQRDFLEIQTPLFTVSSPEWARDYIIPSRLHPGEFYALPQAPQIYKQLLMVGGVDKYFQIAPCFRDEDPRADRHSCEFYQIDAELSFVEQEDVLEICEQFIHDLVSNIAPHKSLKNNKVLRLTYNEAIEYYGSDKPDLRYDMKMIDVSSIFQNTEFSVFRSALDNDGIIKAIKFEKTLTRKEIDEITQVAQDNWAKGLAYIIYEDDGPKSPILKFFSDEELKQLEETMQPKTWDMIFFGADSKSVVNNVLGTVRTTLANNYMDLDQDTLAFAWVTDFPMFELDEDTGKIDFSHNPFGMPQWGMEALETKDPLEIKAYQYDMVCNGYELLSWAIRNHRPDILLKAFELTGCSPEYVKEKYNVLFEAFQYGPPPHGGFAFGFDRLMMLLVDKENIRDMYAFPKSGKAQDMMVWAPSKIDENLLKELGLTDIIKKYYKNK